MHRKLLSALVSACAFTAVLVGPAAASAATLTLKDAEGVAASFVRFDSSSTTITSANGSWECDEFDLPTSITQNAADPVTLQLSNPYSLVADIGGCQMSSASVSVDYSNIQFTAPMEFNADGTGTLPLRVTETFQTSIGTINCVRGGVLDLTYTPNASFGQEINFDGVLSKISGGSFCPANESWGGWFDAPRDQSGDAISWVVTP